MGREGVRKKERGEKEKGEGKGKRFPCSDFTILPLPLTPTFMPMFSILVFAVACYLVFANKLGWTG